VPPADDERPADRGPDGLSGASVAGNRRSTTRSGEEDPMRRSLIALAVFTILLAACGGGSKKAATSSASASASAAPKNTTTTAGSSSSKSAGPGGTVPATGSVDPGGYDWPTNAALYRGLNGKQLEFGCPPGGDIASAFGTGIYTDDSSVCTAAVHAGKIKQADGGQVVIAIQPGQPKYTGTTANGVESQSFEEFDGSFQIVSTSAFRGTTDPQTGGFGWTITAEYLRALTGQLFVFSCPPEAEIGNVYGTGTYTDDSRVCSAAVHAGKIKKGTAGTVVIQIKGEQSSFTASEANGITSIEYAAWPGSYSFVG
jgi:hypothetical protein